jgi:3-phosphoshikimate 1-carboxyvinyltransferase
MKKIQITPIKACVKKITVQGDKSISHRSIIIGSLAKGVTKIKNFLEAEDTLNTAKVYKQLGVQIEKKAGIYYIHGRGLFNFRQPEETLYVGNSGTAIRLSLGVLAAQRFTSTITGDAQIVKRPMKRVIEPLQQMGADFASNQGLAPITVRGAQLKGISYKMPIASAQVKSALLLAALHASGTTVITEPFKSRDHTERMLKYFGAEITVLKNKISVKPGTMLKAADIFVPGDISSAAYFLAAGAMVKNSKITVCDVGLNETRTGILDVMKKMGAKVKVSAVKTLNGEPVGDVTVSTSKLKGISIKGGIIPRLIDEIPVIAVLAAFAKGKTMIRGAKELRVKETDRIKTILTNLDRLGIKTEEYEDGFAVYGNGGTEFKYSSIDTYGDHRIAMAFSIAALASENGLLIKDIECINTSFPDFFRILAALEGKVKK